MTNRILAELLFIAHAALFFFLLFGWTAPQLWPLYMLAIAATLVSDLIFGYCLLSKWEFDLRRRAKQQVAYNYNWTTYYTYWLTNHRMSDVFFGRAATTFLAASLGINIYFHFFAFVL
jgi:hypothetical protein